MSLAIVEPTPIAAHKFERDKSEHYVEPHWCSERLFEVETFKDSIWDPCCGFGRIPEAANRAGLIGLGTDVVNRGWHGQKTMLDFLHTKAPLSENIVCNPPFNIAGRFMRHAIDLPGVEKVAMIFPTARLNAAHWIHGTPLARGVADDAATVDAAGPHNHRRREASGRQDGLLLDGLDQGPHRAGRSALAKEGRMTKHTSVTIKNAVNRILERAASTADPIIDRSPEQKAIRVERMKAELFDLGFSVVTTEWLKAVIADAPLVGMKGAVE